MHFYDSFVSYVFSSPIITSVSILTREKKYTQIDSVLLSTPTRCPTFSHQNYYILFASASFFFSVSPSLPTQHWRNGTIVFWASCDVRISQLDPVYRCLYVCVSVCNQVLIFFTILSDSYRWDCLLCCDISLNSIKWRNRRMKKREREGQT